MRSGSVEREPMQASVTQGRERDVALPLKGVTQGDSKSRAGATALVGIEGPTLAAQ